MFLQRSGREAGFPSPAGLSEPLLFAKVGSRSLRVEHPNPALSGTILAPSTIRDHTRGLISSPRAPSDDASQSATTHHVACSRHTTSHHITLDCLPGAGSRARRTFVEAGGEEGGSRPRRCVRACWQHHVALAMRRVAHSDAPVLVEELRAVPDELLDLLVRSYFSECSYVMLALVAFSLLIDTAIVTELLAMFVLGCATVAAGAPHVDLICCF